MGAQFLTVTEVATETRVKPRSVREWISKRKLGSVKVGRHIRISREELNRFLAEGARPAIVPDFKSLAAGERE